MLYIITGEDTVSSRKKLSELLELNSDVVYLDGKKTGIAEIEMALVSNGLFSDKKIVVVEYFSKVKSDRFLEILKRVQNDDNSNLILWDEVDPSAKIRSLKSAKSFSFTFPKVYFSFMDGLIPSNSASSLATLAEVLKSYEPEQILYSIIKRVRQLLILKSNNYMQFDEFAKMQDWQIGKLRSQSNFWTEDQLKKAFLEYTTLDEKIKTSGLTMDLSHHLDIILAQDLN